MVRIFRLLINIGVIVGLVYAATTFAKRFDFMRQLFAQIFSTQAKIACELLESKQIAELATRKMKWKVITTKESIHESLVMQTIYTLKFGYDLSDISKNNIEVDDKRHIVTIPLPEIRLLSVDTFGDVTNLVSKKNTYARLFGDAHDPGRDDVAEGKRLVEELSRYKLIDSREFAEDFKNALNLLWSNIGTYTLEVKPTSDEVNVKKIFEKYRKDK